MMKRLLVLAIALPLLSSCVAALVGGGIYKSSKTKGQRQEFISQFQKTNMEREEKGLKPLDWCSEAYRFDEAYANNDKECAKRINAYKKGDTTALDSMSQKTPESSAPTSTKIKKQGAKS